MNLFARARAHLNLSPAERATLRLVDGFLIAGLVAALPVLAEALSSRGTIVWNDVLHSALAAGATAVLMAVLKYARAQADAPLATTPPDQHPENTGTATPSA